MSDIDPARPPPPIIERAYQLAESGKFANVPEICEGLIAEGYREIYMHFDGAALRADLSRICRETHARPDRPELAIAPSAAARIAAKARSPARRFDLKAAECRQLAENAHHADTRQIYLRLALSYERLAHHGHMKEQANGGRKSAER